MDWVYNDLDEFDTAPANMRGDYTLELYAQLRPTGQMLDHFRCVPNTWRSTPASWI